VRPLHSAWSFLLMHANTLPRSVYPYYDILDYSRFSITLSELALDTHEAYLRSIPEWRVAQLQAGLLKVREAFLFDTGPGGGDRGKMGPLFFALLSMGVRL
jgi:hypothetical protein